MISKVKKKKRMTEEMTGQTKYCTLENEKWGEKMFKKE